MGLSLLLIRFRLALFQLFNAISLARPALVLPHLQTAHLASQRQNWQILSTYFLQEAPRHVSLSQHVFKMAHFTLTPQCLSSVYLVPPHV